MGIVVFDIDGVLCDSSPAAEALPTLEEVEDSPDEDRGNLFAQWHKEIEDQGLSLRPMPNAEYYVEKLLSVHPEPQVIVYTARHETLHEVTTRWLNAYFPDLVSRPLLMCEVDDVRPACVSKVDRLRTYLFDAGVTEEMLLAVDDDAEIGPRLRDSDVFLHLPNGWTGRRALYLPDDGDVDCVLPWIGDPDEDE